MLAKKNTDSEEEASLWAGSSDCGVSLVNWK